MSTRLHELKCHVPYFEQIWSGTKTFEIRYDDRAYQKGDKFLLREFDTHRPCTCRETGPTHDGATCPKYTGRFLAGEIGCVIGQTPNRGNQRGFNGNGYVVFSLLLTDRSPEPPAVNQ